MMRWQMEHLRTLETAVANTLLRRRGCLAMDGLGTLCWSIFLSRRSTPSSTRVMIIWRPFSSCMTSSMSVRVVSNSLLKRLYPASEGRYGALNGTEDPLTSSAKRFRPNEGVLAPLITSRYSLRASRSDLRTAVTFLAELLQKSGSVDEHRLLAAQNMHQEANTMTEATQIKWQVMRSMHLNTQPEACLGIGPRSARPLQPSCYRSICYGTSSTYVARQSHRRGIC